MRNKIISSGSAMRPSPTKPLANSPCPTGIKWQPYPLSKSRFLTVAGCFHISKSIAGAINIGQRADKYVAVTILSLMPFANFASVVAVQGATTIASAHKPSSTWLFQLSSEIISVKTGFLESVERVSGVIKCLAASVIKT